MLCSTIKCWRTNRLRNLKIPYPSFRAAHLSHHLIFSRYTITINGLVGHRSLLKKYILESSLQFWSKCRTSHRMCSVKAGALKISQISQKNTYVGVSFYHECNFIKKIVQHRCFPVKFEKTFKTSVNDC